MNFVVSVLLPTYNQSAFLPDALGGLASQTFRDFEVIACDDGSTDDTERILSDNGVRTVTHRRNQGTATAINSAAALASGILLTWVSSDNVMHPEWLATLVAAGEPGVGAVYSAFRWIQAGLRPRDIRQGEYRRESLVSSDNCFFGPSFLIRREVWQEHRGGSSHDMDNWLRVEESCWAQGLNIRYVDQVLCDYRRGPWCTVQKHPELYDAPKWRAEAIERRASTFVSSDCRPAVVGICPGAAAR